MNNRLILPPGYKAPEDTFKAKVEEAVESVSQIYLGHTRRLLDESLKDVCGGIAPTANARKKHLVYRPTQDGGRVFYWKGKPMLYVSKPVFKARNGRMEMDVVDKRFYKDEPPKPVPASNLL